MPNQNCPVCGNPDHVYQEYVDPRYGPFVLCSVHGMAVCNKPPETQRAYFHAPTGNRFTNARRWLKEQGNSIHQRSE